MKSLSVPQRHPKKHHHSQKEVSHVDIQVAIIGWSLNNVNLFMYNLNIDAIDLHMYIVMFVLVYLNNRHQKKKKKQVFPQIWEIIIWT